MNKKLNLSKLNQDDLKIISSTEGLEDVEPFNWLEEETTREDENEIMNKNNILKEKQKMEKYIDKGILKVEEYTKGLEDGFLYSVTSKFFYENYDSVDEAFSKYLSLIQLNGIVTLKSKPYILGVDEDNKKCRYIITKDFYIVTKTNGTKIPFEKDLFDSISGECQTINLNATFYKKMIKTT